MFPYPFPWNEANTKPKWILSDTFPRVWRGDRDWTWCVLRDPTHLLTRAGADWGGSHASQKHPGSSLSHASPFTSSAVQRLGSPWDTTLPCPSPGSPVPFRDSPLAPTRWRSRPFSSPCLALGGARCAGLCSANSQVGVQGEPSAGDRREGSRELESGAAHARMTGC